MKALILAAGYGTRLYPYTKHFPKPLLKVKDRPIIDFLVDKLGKVEDLSSIVVVTNNRFFGHFKRWKEEQPLKARIKLLNDHTESPEDKLGATGDMDLAFRSEGLSQDFLVLGGDNFFREPLEDFMDFARSHSPAISIGVFDVKNKKEASNFGVVVLDKKHRITDFQEKPAKPKSTLAAMCLYYFPKEKLRLVGKCLSGGEQCFDNVGAYIKWLADNEQVFAFTFKELWYDIGRIQTYEALNKTLNKKEKK